MTSATTNERIESLCHGPYRATFAASFLQFHFNENGIASGRKKCDAGVGVGVGVGETNKKRSASVGRDPAAAIGRRRRRTRENERPIRAAGMETKKTRPLWIATEAAMNQQQQQQQQQQQRGEPAADN